MLIVGVGSATGMGRHCYAAARAVLVEAAPDLACAESVWAAADLAAYGELWIAAGVLLLQRGIEATLQADRATGICVSDAIARPPESSSLPHSCGERATGAASANLARDTHQCRLSDKGSHVSASGNSVGTIVAQHSLDGPGDMRAPA
jgi:hypothetical protein